jgi:hypothetical protein
MGLVEGILQTKEPGHKALCMGYYWPTIFQDAKKYVKGCDSFQWMGQPIQSDEMSLQTQLVIEPFEKWALYFVGPINPSSHQKSYILVCTDYITKWVEARALSKSTKKVVMDFLFEEIFVWYGMPREIVTDGGAQFTGNKIEALLKKYRIQHQVTSPYHPQENGKVESTNKVLENILTKTVASHFIDWVDRLSEALWAYRQLGKIQRASLHLSWCMVSV